MLRARSRDVDPDRQYLRTPLGRLLLGFILGAATLLFIQHAFHFSKLILEHRLHVLMVVPYVLLLIFPVSALIVYRRQEQHRRQH